MSSEPGEAPELETAVLADVESRPVSWLWEGRIAYGRLCLLCGDPGVGKSFLTCALAAAVSRGVALPGGPEIPAADVLILSAEDSPEDTIRPRVEGMGGDLSRVRVVLGVRREGDPSGYFNLGADLEVLERHLAERPVGLLSVDPLDAYVGVAVDSHRSAAIRSLLGPLAALAERTDAGVVAVQHLAKAARERPIYRPQGSIAYLAAARTALLVAPDPEQPTSLIRHVVSLKSNLGPPAPALRFTLDGGTFGWLSGEASTTAEQLLASPSSEQDRSALDEAQEVLRDILGQGPKTAGEVLREGAKAGCSERTLQRARRALGVVSRKSGMHGGWEWTLPSELSEPKVPEDGQAQNLGVFGNPGAFEDAKNYEDAKPHSSRAHARERSVGPTLAEAKTVFPGAGLLQSIPLDGLVPPAEDGEEPPHSDEDGLSDWASA